jgi:hypothetical protein
MARSFVGLQLRSSTRSSAMNLYGGQMIRRPDGISAFEFAVLSSLRAAQLQRGCTPRVTPSHKMAVTAQHEIAARKVSRAADTTAIERDNWQPS